MVSPNCFLTNGIIRYLGRVKDGGFKARMSYHKRTKGLKPVHYYQGLSKNVARGLEELGIIYCHTLNTKDKTMNQIHGISIKNVNREMYLEDAYRFLLNCGEEWLLNLFE